MIQHQDAIRIARALIGTPYSELDCINLIKKVIRTAPGGAKDYTTAGSNSLWRSGELSGKYRDLTWRQEGLAGMKAGMLAFKADGDDYHHVGIVTGEGTVIHSSSTQGVRGVVETPLTADEGWTHLAKHRYIKASSVGSDDTFLKGEGTSAEESEENAMTIYRAVVKLNDPDSKLNVRSEPNTSGSVIGKLVNGQSVTVQAESGGWALVGFEEGGGYVSMDYLVRVKEEEENLISVSPDVTIIDSDGNRFKPVGSWRVLIGSTD